MRVPTDAYLSDANLQTAYNSQPSHAGGVRAVAELAVQAFAAHQFHNLADNGFGIAGAIDRLTEVAKEQGS